MEEFESILVAHLNELTEEITDLDEQTFISDIVT